MRNSNISLNTGYLIFSILLFLIFSCRSPDNEIVDNIDKVNVNFAIAGIMEEPVSTIASISGGSNRPFISNINSTIEGRNFIIEGGGEAEGINSKAKSKQAVTYTPIPPGIRVRLLIYEIEQDGSEVFKSNLGVPVQQDFFAITLEKNRNYKFYAYSYNSFTTYPPSPSDDDYPLIPTVNNNALIYAGGSIAVLNSPVHVNVVFRHVTSRISVAVDAQSYFATSISALNVSLDNVALTTHNLDLRTGNIVGTPLSTSVSNLSFVFADFENSPAKKLSQDRLYTSTTLNSYSYKINRLEVIKNGINEVLIENSNPRSVTATGFAGPLTTVYFSRNYVYPAVNVGGNVWAKGNLFYQSSFSPGQQYRFAEPLNVKKQEACYYYFSWNSSLPRSESGSTSVDPCTLVYPAGKWKTPSETDYQNLLNNSTISNEGTGAVKFTNPTTLQSLTLNQAGWLFGTGCTVSNDTDGQYWTSSESNLGVLGRIFEIGNESGGPRTGFDSEAKSIGASVRCIKAN